MHFPTNLALFQIIQVNPNNSLSQHDLVKSDVLQSNATFYN